MIRESRNMEVVILQCMAQTHRQRITETLIHLPIRPKNIYGFLLNLLA